MIPFRQTKLAFMEVLCITEGCARALVKLMLLWWLALLNSVGMLVLDPMLWHTSLKRVKVRDHAHELTPTKTWTFAKPDLIRL